MTRTKLLALAVLLLPVLASAQTTIIDHVPINLSGTQQIAGGIPNGVNVVTAILERSTTDRSTFWPSVDTIVRLRTRVLVPGSPWREWCGFEGHGGIHIRRDGTEARQSTVRCHLPSGTGRQMELVLEMSGSPATLVSEVTVIVE